MAFVHQVMMKPAEKDEVVGSGLAAACPVRDVVCFAQAGVGTAAWVGAATVA